MFNMLTKKVLLDPPEQYSELRMSLLRSPPPILFIVISYTGSAFLKNNPKIAHSNDFYSLETMSPHSHL
jgi:ssDNA-specific exonuclease RecJ